MTFNCPQKAGGNLGEVPTAGLRAWKQPVEKVNEEAGHLGEGSPLPPGARGRRYQHTAMLAPMLTGGAPPHRQQTAEAILPHRVTQDGGGQTSNAPTSLNYTRANSSWWNPQPI